MGDVVRFAPAVDGREPEPPHKWLRRGAASLCMTVGLAGYAVACFTTIVLILGVVPGCSLLSLGPTSAYLGPAPNLPGVVLFSTLPAPTRAAYVATFLLEMVPALFVLFNLRALLRLYAKGHLFGSEHSRCLTHGALGLAIYAFAPLLGHLLVMFAGHGVDQVWIHASDFHALLFAAVLLIFERVMDAGCEAKQDSDGFV